MAVPDPRLQAIADISKPQKIIPTQLEFVDIAGLVRGASKGEGLGNQFLGNIREVHAICHVVRCFEDDNVTHVEGRIDPVADAETVETELMLADLESLEKREVSLGKRAKGGDKDAVRELDLVNRALAALRDGKAARTVKLADDERRGYRALQLLTGKPVLYVCNVEEAAAADGNAQSKRVFEMAAKQGAAAVVISAAIEEEIAQLSTDAERGEFLESLGLAETGLARVIRAGYGLLELITFFTQGPKEVRAWTVPGGAKAPEAAGAIHTDFQRGFIRAETIAYDDFISLGGEQACKDAGKMRQEGKDYTVKDGDLMLFKFNV